MNWIKSAINPKNKGALHRSLGVPAGRKIPAGKLKAAAAKGGSLGRRARLAETLGRLRRRGKGMNKGGLVGESASGVGSRSYYGTLQHGALGQPPVGR